MLSDLVKTTVKGTYSFNKKRKRSANGLALLGFLLLPLSLVIGTQFFAWDVGRNRLPGELFSCMGMRVYAPWQIMDWMDVWQTKHRGLEDFANSLIAMGGCAFLGIGLIAAGVRKNKASGDAANLYGSRSTSSRWPRREAEKEWDSSSLLFCLGKN